MKWSFWLGMMLVATVGTVAAKPTTPAYESHCVIVTGKASLEGVTDEFARQMAIRDALKLASMQNNLSISSRQDMKDFAITHDTTRFTTHSKVQQFKILDEGVKRLTEEAWLNERLAKSEQSEAFDQQPDNPNIPLEEAFKADKKQEKPETYEVKLQVCLTEDPKACHNVPGNQLQPKLAIAQVVTTDVYGARDISNLLIGYQHELERRLKLAGYDNQVKIENGMNLQAGVDVFPNLDPNILDPIRDQTGAQYVLLTVLRSVKALNESAGMWNDVKRFYNQEIKPNARYLELDYYIVDLMSHQIVARDRLGFDVKGDVVVGRDRPFGTSSFFTTDTGMVFNRLLNQQVDAVADYLNCKPVKTQIIDIRDGEYILYLSAASGAQVGDELAVYHTFGANVRFQGVDLGVDSKPSGFLKIERIQSKFAIAKELAKEGRMEIGDFVTTW